MYRLLLLFLIPAGALAMESPEYIKERIAAHTHEGNELIQEGKASWQWLVHNDYDIREVAQLQVDEHMSRLCAQWSKDQADLLAVAYLVNELEVVEAKAVGLALQRHKRTMDSKAQADFERSLDTIRSEIKTPMLIDYVGVANDLPEYFANAVARMCQRHTNRFNQPKREHSEPHIVFLGDKKMSPEETEELRAEIILERKQRTKQLKGQ